jgi:hypothetical protein
MDLTNEAILETVEQEVLHPEVVRRALQRVVSALSDPTDTVVPHRTALQVELTVLEQELARLAAAVAQGGDLKPLLDGIQAREQRRRSLQTKLAGLEGVRPVSARDLQDIQREVEVRLTDWRGLLRRQVTQSRQILRKLLVGRIVFRQRPDGSYEFSGEASLGRVLAGIICTKAGVAPYLKALRSQALTWSTFPLALFRSADPGGTHHSVWRLGPASGARRLFHRFGPGTRPAVGHRPLSPHRPVSSEPYLRRLSGMMVISRDVAINGRASGSSWSLRAYPPWTKRPDAFGSR